MVNIIIILWIFQGLERAKSKELTYKVLFGRNMYNKQI